MKFVSLWCWFLDNYWLQYKFELSKETKPMKNYFQLKELMKCLLN